MSDPDQATVARVHRALDPLHSMIYFAPEAEEELTGVGLKPGRMPYFASRAAAMGPVAAGVVASTFYNFSPSLVARSIPDAWERSSCADILAARLRAVDRALRRLLGEDAVDGDEVAEAAALARTAATDLPVAGRPLYAGHADLPWPDQPHLVLWHAITLLREFRGDGHVAALLDAGLTGLEALVTHTATGRGFTVAGAKATRGWSDQDWAAAEAELAERGLVADGALTEAGERLRGEVEAATDAMDVAPWRSLSSEATARLTELGKQLSRAISAAGAFPAELFAAAR